MFLMDGPAPAEEQSGAGGGVRGGAQGADNRAFSQDESTLPARGGGGGGGRLPVDNSKL